jgi:hypothetical protein
MRGASTWPTTSSATELWPRLCAGWSEQDCALSASPAPAIDRRSKLNQMTERWGADERAHVVAVVALFAELGDLFVLEHVSDRHAAPGIIQAELLAAVDLTQPSAEDEADIPALMRSEHYAAFTRHL